MLKNDTYSTVKIAIPVVIAAFLLMANISGGLISSVYGQQQGTGSIQSTLMNKAFFLGFRMYQSVGFQIPGNAQNVVLSGQYRVNGAQSPIIGVYVVDGSQCVPGMDLSLCPAVYMYSRELGASGSIRLDPGKLYYLVFTNEGSILEGAGAGATVAAQFVVSYNVL
jgi:hypothetical protein